MFDSAKAAQKAWAKTPLWKRAELLHKVAALMRQNAQPIADCLVKEVRPGHETLCATDVPYDAYHASSRAR